MEVAVGEGEARYDKIVITFKQYTKSWYARVVIVNPLNEPSPKLDLCAISTYNKFTAYWVQQTLEGVEEVLGLYCRSDVGSLLWHASDDNDKCKKNYN